MQARHSLYREIHKGLRRLLSDLVAKSGRLDFSDAAAVSRFRAEVVSGFRVLEAHAEHEERFVLSVVAAHAPALAQVNGDDHVMHLAAIGEVRAMLESIDSASPDAREKGDRFNVRLSRLAGEFFVHMAEEEEVILPALWESVSDERLIEVHQQIVGSLTPDEMAQDAGWMFPAMNPAERVEMLAGIRMTAPEAAFAFACSIARGALTEAEYEAVEQGLASLAAVA